VNSMRAPFVSVGPSEVILKVRAFTATQLSYWVYPWLLIHLRMLKLNAPVSGEPLPSATVLQDPGVSGAGLAASDRPARSIGVCE